MTSRRFYPEQPLDSSGSRPELSNPPPAGRPPQKRPSRHQGRSTALPGASRASTAVGPSNACRNPGRTPLLGARTFLHRSVFLYTLTCADSQPQVALRRWSGTLGPFRSSRLPRGMQAQPAPPDLRDHLPAGEVDEHLGLSARALGHRSPERSRLPALPPRHRRPLSRVARGPGALQPRRAGPRAERARP